MNDKSTTEVAKPKLWNPNAAANWSFLFTPIFGAWLQAKNWRELNQPERALKSMNWVYGTVIFFVVSEVMLNYFPDEMRGNWETGIGLAFLLAWYFLSGRQQAKYLKENNLAYDKKGWAIPLLCGFAAVILLFALIISMEPEPSITGILESESVGIVTQILQDQLGGDATCKAVSITKEISDGFYHAVAYLDNGNENKIAIEVQGDQIIVKIPEQ